MKKFRVAEEQIIGVMREDEAVAARADGQPVESSQLERFTL